MGAKTNTLKVRRVDLLEQLEERYFWMTKEKEKYEKKKQEYELACDKYFTDVAKWEVCIPNALEKALESAETSWSERRGYGGRSNFSYSANKTVYMEISDLERIIGPYPQKPENQVETPTFLARRWASSYRSSEMPSVYEAVYQTIKLLELSDDEYVSASTYQVALEAL